MPKYTYTITFGAENDAEAREQVWGKGGVHPGANDSFEDIYEERLEDERGRKVQDY